MNAITHNIRDARDGSRRNMMLSALLRCGSEQSPVRIRNMSSQGALIDSPIVPEPNSPVELVRGSYVAQGRVVWSNGGRCGLRFSSQLSVNDWLAPIETQPPLPLASQGNPLLGKLEPPFGPTGSAGLTTVVLEDLLVAAQLVEQAARTLARDRDFLRHHIKEGRDLICAMQLLAKMCDGVSLRACPSPD